MEQVSVRERWVTRIISSKVSRGVSQTESITELFE
jgi:hypothetical protein